MVIRQHLRRDQASAKPGAVHATPTSELLDQLTADPTRGLTPAEANERLSRFGPNVLPEAPPRSAWLRLLDQFTSLLIIVLIIAALLAAFAGNIKDGTVTGKDVKSRSLAKSDLSPRALSSISGQPGPQGPQGPAGPKGHIGPEGPAGP